MIYIFIVVGVFLLTGVVFLLTQGRSSDERETLARIDTILAGGENLATDDPILLELEKKTWVEVILGRSSLAHRLTLNLNQAARSISVDVFLLWCVGSGFVGFIASWLFWPGLLMELGTFVVFAFIPFVLLNIRRERRIKAFDSALPDVIDSLQRMLVAGLARQSAFENTAEKAKEPAKSEFLIVVNRMRRGADERQELTRLAERVPTPDLRIFVTALLVQKETGSPDFPEILTRLTDTIRVRNRLTAEMKAKTAQGRLSGVMLALIPVFMAGAMKILNPSYLDPLFNDPRGHYMLAYSIVSDVIGNLVIRPLTTMEV